ncbi:MAG: LEPR-XLL domain-containing protein, partial [Sedimentisphaerales bacterium]|nr:LEPR-XLL domain-containing protein [Sedimentisphaerales bacterium]
MVGRKKNMRRDVVYCSFLQLERLEPRLLLNGAAAEGGESLNKWTVLAYYSGDNDLEEYLLDIINGLEQVDVAGRSNGEVQYLLQIDRHPEFDNTTEVPDGEGVAAVFTDTRRGELVYDGDTNRISTQLTPVSFETGDGVFSSEANMGAAESLLDFVQWGMATAPAEHYVLVIYDHGHGYERISSDNTSDDSLTMPELGAVFDQIDYIDVLVMDACLMQMLEVNTELVGEVGYVVASEPMMSIYACLDNDWLEAMSDNPDITAASLAQDVHDANMYLSLVDNSRIPMVTSALNDFV